MSGTGPGAGPGTPVASVTYSASTTVMHSALPGHLFTSLTPHLPLHNLHWRPDPALQSLPSFAGSASSSTSTAGTNPIRTIQALPLSFEPFAVAQTRAHQVQQRLYNPNAPQNATSQILDPAYPFVHLYIAVCPDSETYRTTVRNEIRAWLVGIGAFTAALQVSAGGISPDAVSSDSSSANGGASSASGSKPEKRASLPSPSEPEFLIVLVSPPEGMADLLTGTSGAAATPGTETPPVAQNDGGKAARTSTGSVLSSSSTGFFSSMTASKNKGASAVLEKMRADFNANKRERVVHVSKLPPVPARPSSFGPRTSSVGDDMPPTPRSTSAQLDPTVFIDFLTRLKECSSNSLGVVLRTRMASIRSLLNAIENLEPSGPHRHQNKGSEDRAQVVQDQGSRLFAQYIQSQAFVLRCLEGLGLWEDALEGWNSISLPMAHPALLKLGKPGAVSPSTPNFLDPADLLPAMPGHANPALVFRIALHCRRATIQGAYLGKVLQVLNEGAREIRAIGRGLAQTRQHSVESEAAAESESEYQSKLGEEKSKDHAETATGPVDAEAEVWTYQAALQLARTCDSWAADRGDTSESRSTPNSSSTSLNQPPGGQAGTSASFQGQISPAFHAARAEVLEVARRQMDRMGIKVGWLPNIEPWLVQGQDAAPTESSATDSTPQSAEDVQIPTSVRSLFSSREIFDLRYSSLTERILSAYMQASSATSTAGSVNSTGAGLNTSGRRRHVLFLRIVLTSLDLIRGRWKEAYTALGPLADACAPVITGPLPLATPNTARLGGVAGSGWAAIEAILRRQCLRCHSALKLPQDRAWVGLVVAWLRATITAKVTQPDRFSSMRPEAEMPLAADAAADASEPINETSVFTALRSASASMEKEVAVSGFSPFEILPLDKVATREAAPSSSEQNTESASHPATLKADGHFLRVRIRSALGAPVQVDDVRLCLTNGEREQLWFTSGKVTLREGSAAGDVQCLQLYCASYAPGTYAVDVTQVRIAKIIFQVPLLPQGGPTATADSNTAFAPGRTLISQGPRGHGPASGAGQGVRMAFPFLVQIPTDPDALQAAVRLPDVIRLGQPRCGIIEIRTGRNFVRTADIALLMLHDIAGGGSSILSGLAQAELVPSEHSGSVEVVAPSPTASDKVQVKNLPAGSVICLQFPLLEASTVASFRTLLNIDHYSGASRQEADSSESSLLKRQFRRVQDLLIALPLGVNAQDVFRSDHMTSRFTISSAGGSRLEIQTPDLNVRRGDGNAKNQAEHLSIERQPNTTQGGSAAQVVTVQQPASFVFKLTPQKGRLGGRAVFELTLRYKLTLANADGTWQTIIIPVEVPNMDIVNEVKIVALGQSARTLSPYWPSGQPIRMRFTINSTAQWSQVDSESSPSRTETFLYDVVTDHDTWLVCGLTRGTMQVSVGGVDPALQLNVTLIPLREGELPLPHLTLKPLEPQRVSSETYMADNEARITVGRQLGRPVGLALTKSRNIQIAV
ncbi:hypothetical protein OC861_004595 [Tilletia horrida]|nr:hypothetical protein OC861_004595 [Tilletia horrida]